MCTLLFHVSNNIFAGQRATRGNWRLEEKKSELKQPENSGNASLRRPCKTNSASDQKTQNDEVLGGKILQRQISSGELVFDSV